MGKITDHLKRNKSKYLGAATAAALGGTALYLKSKTNDSPDPLISKNKETSKLSSTSDKSEIKFGPRKELSTSEKIAKSFPDIDKYKSRSLLDLDKKDSPTGNPLIDADRGLSRSRSLLDLDKKDSPTGNPLIDADRGLSRSRSLLDLDKPKKQSIYSLLIQR